MKILYYSAHPDLVLKSSSGYGTHMREMIKAFEQAGHTVAPVIMGGIEMPTRAQQEASAARRTKNRLKQVVPGSVWESLKHAGRLQQDRQFERLLHERIREVQPDLLYERASYLQRSGLRVAGQVGLPHVLEVNTPANAERRFLKRPRSLFERKAEAVERKQLEQATLAAVVSPALVDYFAEKYGIARDKLLCTPNGVDPRTVQADEASVRAIQTRHRLHGRFVVGFVGSIIQWQRVDLLIQACGLLHEAAPDLRLLIVGNSRLVPHLKQLSHELGVADRVIFAGRVAHSDVFNYVAAMDVTVLPANLWYGSPTKLFEYGAMGKPVIAPDNVTVRALIRQGEEGLLVTPDAGVLAGAIRRLQEDPAARLQMAGAFQHKVRTHYTWARNVDRVLQALANETRDALFI